MPEIAAAYPPNALTTRSSRPDRILGVAYWLIVVSLLALGFVSIFSIGRGFWLLAVAMIVLGPFRAMPRVWGPGMALAVGFLIGFVAVAPWSCTETAIFDPTGGTSIESRTACLSLIGVEQSGPEGFQPSLIPGIIAGVGFGLLAAGVAWLFVRRPESDQPPVPR